MTGSTVDDSGEVELGETSLVDVGVSDGVADVDGDACEVVEGEGSDEVEMTSAAELVGVNGAAEAEGIVDSTTEASVEEGSAVELGVTLGSTEALVSDTAAMLAEEATLEPEHDDKTNDQEVSVLFRAQDRGREGCQAWMRVEGTWNSGQEDVRLSRRCYLRCVNREKNSQASPSDQQDVLCITLGSSVIAYIAIRCPTLNQSESAADAVLPKERPESQVNGPGPGDSPCSFVAVAETVPLAPGS